MQPVSFEEIILQLVHTDHLDRIEASSGNKILDQAREISSSSDLHRSLYRLYLLAFARPWDTEFKNIDHPFLIKIRRVLESNWDEQLRFQYKDLLAMVPRADQFNIWAESLVQSHSSGVKHPLFHYLEKTASLEHIKEFLRQESPFDMFFSDHLTCLLGGIYGEMRMEIAENFWDEAGHGIALKSHRKMRSDMLVNLGLKPDEHLIHPEKFCWEELAMANTFFKMTINRSRITQGIGALYSTELAVPGRMECVEKGLIRVGVKEKSIKYVSDHITVDVEHAQGWCDRVVTPLLNNYPEVVDDLAFGLINRLDCALLVCDKLYQILTSKAVQENDFTSANN